MSLAGRRVLVTGATGFIGTHTVALLGQRGADVRASSRRGTGPPRVASAVDLLDVTAVGRLLDAASPTQIVHLGGAIARPGMALEDLLAANEAGTETLLAAAASRPEVESVVVTSSSAVYGSAGPLPITESAAVVPSTSYGVSKAAQEAVAAAWRERAGYQVVVARLFTVVGPGQSPALALSSFARQIARAERGGPARIEVGRLDTRRDYVDVRDVAQALAVLVDGRRTHDVYNVASGVGRTVREGLDVLLRLAGRPFEVVTDPTRVRSGDVPAQIGDSARLRVETGWEPTVAFEQTMADLLEHWRQEPEAP